jgi:hypothetical protein
MVQTTKWRDSQLDKRHGRPWVNKVAVAVAVDVDRGRARAMARARARAMVRAMVRAVVAVAVARAVVAVARVVESGDGSSGGGYCYIGKV